jgi:hypothetical protein
MIELGQLLQAQAAKFLLAVMLSIMTVFTTICHRD